MAATAYCRAMTNDFFELRPVPSASSDEVFDLRAEAEGVHRPNRQIHIVEHLKLIVASEPVWDLIEKAESLRSEAKPAGRRRRYSLMDVMVAEIATQLLGSAAEATLQLSDPEIWDDLSLAAQEAFPNDPNRRLSLKAPSRSEHYRARRELLDSEAHDAFERALGELVTWTTTD